jgi:hypothetical protein
LLEIVLERLRRRRSRAEAFSDQIESINLIDGLKLLNLQQAPTE